MKNDREYRSMELRILPQEEEVNRYMVEGYASTFDTYVLFSQDGVDYSERIEPTAFEGADLSDVVFRVDHEGPVYARSSAGTVHVWVDEHGLAQKSDLSKTQRSRDVFEDIEAGNYPQMSFAFTVAEDHYDKATHTRVIDRIAKVFDVSAVSFPANPNTSLSIATRSFFDGVIEGEKAERLEREAMELRRRKLMAQAELLGGQK